VKVDITKKQKQDFLEHSQQLRSDRLECYPKPAAHLYFLFIFIILVRPRLILWWSQKHVGFLIRFGISGPTPVICDGLPG